MPEKVAPFQLCKNLKSGFTKEFIETKDTLKILFLGVLCHTTLEFKGSLRPDRVGAKVALPSCNLCDKANSAGGRSDSWSGALNSSYVMETAQQPQMTSTSARSKYFPEI